MTPNDPIVLDIETSATTLIRLGLGERCYPRFSGLRAYRALCRGPWPIVCHTPFDLRWLAQKESVPLPGVFHNTRVMAWLVDENQPLDLEALVERYCGLTKPRRIFKRQGAILFLRNDGAKVPIEDAPLDELDVYLLNDLTTTAALYAELRTKLQAQELWQHFTEEAAPFSLTLLRMELRGIPFDRDGCDRLLIDVSEEASEKRAVLARQVDGGLGVFNPGSHPQVSRYLYTRRVTLPYRARLDPARLRGKRPEVKEAIARSVLPRAARLERVGREYAHAVLELPGRGLQPPTMAQVRAVRGSVDGSQRHHGRHSEPSYSVAAPLLRLTHGQDPWVRDLLEWRGLDKLRGYLASYKSFERAGRIHPTYDQCGAVTGRISTREPNLQQVPTATRSTSGRGEDTSDYTASVRDLFRGALVVGDYSQLEARLSAHFSGDELMLEAFHEGKDLYGLMAARAWGGEESKENPRRKLMKTTVLSTQYGAQADKLSVLLTLAGFPHSPREAQGLLDTLERLMPRLFAWRQEVIASAQHLGYIVTIGGRPRRLPDMASAEWKKKSNAERQAVNSKVQGSAADIVRAAMQACEERVPEKEVALLLQVHDEMLWERGPGYTAATLPNLRDICEQGHGFDLTVPLVFEIEQVESWGEKAGTGSTLHFGEFDAVVAAAQ